jgi:hypothetical protein
MVITAAVIGIVAIPLSQFVINGVKSYTIIDGQTNASTELTILSGKMISIIRNATTIIDTESDSFTFTSYAKATDTLPSQYRYFISGKILSVGITPPGSSTETVKVLRTDMALGGNSLFTYEDQNSNLLSNPVNPATVFQVNLYLAANPNSALSATPISVSNDVSIRNLKTNL